MPNNGKSVKKILIVGLPNTGKSLIFSNLTGKFTLVANSPLTTIELKRASLEIGNQKFEIIDSPGLSNLYLHSEEEILVRDAIIFEKPDIIIQCIDAGRLKQSLTLTVDLQSLGIPMLIILNAIDETAKKGIWIDSITLSHILGIPVIESMAVYGTGTKDILNAILNARPGKIKLKYGDIIEEGLKSIASKLPEDEIYKRSISILILMNDLIIYKYLEKKYGQLVVAAISKEAKKTGEKFTGNMIRVLDHIRDRWIDEIEEKVIKRQKIVPRELSQTFARLSRHPVFGIPILLFVLYLIYYMVVNVANVFALWMNNLFWAPVEKLISKTVPSGFWHDFLIGDYGVVSLGVANALLTILPILLVFFLMFNILEDTGYLPNLSVLSKRFLGKMGLSGFAIMPMILGFGCKTMATLTTRMLHSKKERYISIYLIAFAIPCAAQIGISISILGMIGLTAFIIAFSVLTFMEIISGIALNKILKEDDKQDFILELPPIRLPNLKLIIKKTYYKLYWFLKESFMVFIYAALTLFTLDKLGVLNALKNVLSPIVKGFLGLPLSMVDTIILCVASRNVSGGFMINLIKKGELNYTQCIVAVVFTTMFAPCFNNIMVMVKELGGKNALLMLIAINLSAFLAAGLLNWMLILLL